MLLVAGAFSSLTSSSSSAAQSTSPHNQISRSSACGLHRTVFTKPNSFRLMQMREAARIWCPLSLAACWASKVGPQNKKYGTCQFGSFLRRATSPLSLPALPYPAPIFSARASSATVADALISLSNVTSRPRHAFDTWYFLRGVVWSHDKAGPVQFVHNGEIQYMAQGAPILGLK